MRKFRVVYRFQDERGSRTIDVKANDENHAEEVARNKKRLVHPVRIDILNITEL